MPDGQYMVRERVHSRQKERGCMAWAAVRWCNDTQCLQSLEILRIILDQNKFSLQEFLKLFVQTKNSQYQADFIVCAVCPSDVDMTPWQPIRGILVTNEGQDSVFNVNTRGWGYSSRRWGGAVRLLLSGGWLPVMSGLQTINDDI